ncbi:MAG: 23S rRNA (uracil(1939)-C(5))-methyltransferase RlmD [Lachnospiraceae bacterium]|nr:23S rRNA (uracil(1939)-C(5))-methyltransferase RlmD [Lachnospiraceae bacterium]
MAKTYTVRCKELSDNGDGVVIFNNKKFDVPGVLPGEKCDIELVYRKGETKADSKARLVKVLEPSADRVNPGCRLFGKCGACSLLHMKYEDELEFKQEKVKKLFAGLGIQQLPIIGSDKPEHYRNKVYAAFDFVKERGKVKIVAGMYNEGTHSVTGTADCLLQNSMANSIIKTVIEAMRETGTRVYDEDTKTGTLRHCYIRVSKKTGKVMLVLVTGTPEFTAKKHFVDILTKKHPCISTIIHNVNTKKTSMVLGEKDTVIFGPGYIEDQLCGVNFRISPHSFYQVNPVQTEKLYKTAIEFAKLNQLDTVLDAYCGIGTIALSVADKCAKVIGVELNKDAVADAIKNAELNEAESVLFYEGDAGEYMKECEESPDVVFMDPPRSGSSKEFIDALIEAGPKKIVYISCNPVTQVRDVRMLVNGGYKAVKMQAVDMFSRTPEVENIVLLEK